MPFYGVAERRVQPGRMESYMAHARALAERWATPAGQLSYRLCLDDDDPDSLLLLSTWPSPAAFKAALPSLPSDLRDAVIADSVVGPGEWRWYRPLRTVERFSVRSSRVVAARFVATPTAQAEADARLRAWVDEAMARPGVVALAHLADLDDPTSFMLVGDFVDAEEARCASDALVRLAAAVPLDGLRRFSGRVGLRWDPIDLDR